MELILAFTKLLIYKRKGNINISVATHAVNRGVNEYPVTGSAHNTLTPF